MTTITTTPEITAALRDLAAFPWVRDLDFVKRHDAETLAELVRLGLAEVTPFGNGVRLVHITKQGRNLLGLSRQRHQGPRAVGESVKAYYLMVVHDYKVVGHSHAGEHLVIRTVPQGRYALAVAKDGTKQVRRLLFPGMTSGLDAICKGLVNLLGQALQHEDLKKILSTQPGRFRVEVIFGPKELTEAKAKALMRLLETSDAKNYRTALTNLRPKITHVEELGF